jgi:hypothetical protein
VFLRHLWWVAVSALLGGHLWGGETGFQNFGVWRSSTHVHSRSQPLSSDTIQIQIDTPSWHVATFASHQSLQLLVPPGSAAAVTHWNEPNFPVLPRFARQWEIPADAEIDVQVFPLQTRTVPGLALHRLQDSKNWSGPPIDEWPNTWNGTWFPGSLVNGSVKKGVLTLQFSPFQWNSQSGELVAVERMEVRIRVLRWANIVRDWKLSQSESLIVTTRSMKAAAEKLQKFHASHHGIQSSLLFVEDLEVAPLKESEYPAGYFSDRSGDSVVIPYNAATGEGFNAERARQLAAQLQQWMSPGSGAKVKYVTLLGSVEQIPPSFYTVIRWAKMGGWLATDQCYSGHQQCMSPQLAVGRLPFSTEQQLDVFLEKQKLFLERAATAPSELALFGGKPFGGHFYDGELGTLRLLDAKSNWWAPRKFFRTKQNYNFDSVTEALTGKGESLLLYQLDHGKGDEMAVEGWLIHSSSFEKAAAAEPSKLPPIMASIACSNGAYDIDLIQKRGRVFRSEALGTHAVGVSLMLSPSGAVAYLGSNREALGSAQFVVDTAGNLDLTGSNHSVELLESIFKNYHDTGHGRLGDFVLESQRQFVMNHASGLPLERNRWSYFNLVFLGDPTLPLPTRSRKQVTHTVAQSKTVLEPAGGVDPFPGMTLRGALDWVLKVETAVETLADFFRLTVFDEKSSGDEIRVRADVLNAGVSDFNVSPIGKAADEVGFIRLENQLGSPAERQIWFRKFEKVN